MVQPQIDGWKFVECSCYFLLTLRVISTRSRVRVQNIKIRVLSYQLLLYSFTRMSLLLQRVKCSVTRDQYCNSTTGSLWEVQRVI